MHTLEWEKQHNGIYGLTYRLIAREDSKPWEYNRVGIVSHEPAKDGWVFATVGITAESPPFKSSAEARAWAIGYFAGKGGYVIRDLPFARFA